MSFTYKSQVTYLTVVVVLLLAIFVQAIAPPKAMAAPLYSCGTHTSIGDHCYGIVEWDGPVNGADARIGTRGITGGDCFVVNEIWLLDSTFTYWIEAGMIAYINWNNNAPTLYWTDFRPNGGGLHNHFGGSLVSGDYGSNALTRITQSSSNTYNISISAPITQYSGVSTNSFSNPGAIQAGMELCGSQGASVPPVGITNNRWLDGSGWHYETDDGQFTNVNPPANGFWNVPASQSSTGGDWSVCVVGAGC